MCQNACVYRFSSLVKQNKKAKICFVIHIAGERKLFFYIYAVIVKQKNKSSANHYFYEVKMHSNERHPLFYLISFIGIYSPLTDIVIIHIVYINETNPYTPICIFFKTCLFIYFQFRLQLVSFSELLRLLSLIPSVLYKDEKIYVIYYINKYVISSWG